MNIQTDGSLLVVPNAMRLIELGESLDLRLGSPEIRYTGTAELSGYLKGRLFFSERSSAPQETSVSQDIFFAFAVKLYFVDVKSSPGSQRWSGLAPDPRCTSVSGLEDLALALPKNSLNLSGGRPMTASEAAFLFWELAQQPALRPTPMWVEAAAYPFRMSELELLANTATLSGAEPEPSDP